jgi:hypothetical protein
MYVLTKKAIVEIGRIGADELPLAAGQAVVVIAQQYFSQLIQGFCRARAESHGASYARQIISKVDMCHGDY